MAILKGKRRKVYNRYNGRCAYCGVYMMFEEFTIDHINPESLYKKKMVNFNNLSNLMPSCRLCNSRKGNTNLDIFRKVVQKYNKIEKFYFETLTDFLNQH